MHVREPYVRSSIEGEFWKNHSVRRASGVEGVFRAPPEGGVPIGLTTFLRPTAENFNRFVMTLDKLLSDSIDLKFFEGKLPLETETPRPDGKIVVQKKGTLA